MSDFRQGRSAFQGGPGRFGQGTAAAPSFPAPTDQQLKAIIQEGDAKPLVDSAELLGKVLAERGLTTSQIRGVFGTVRQIQGKWPYNASEADAKGALRQLLLLKPKLAYQASRDRASGVSDLQRVLVPAIDLVSNREQFSRLVDYFEAILAYHKAAGGRD